MRTFFATLLLSATIPLTACSSSTSSSGVATVNIDRITAHWNKFSDYERQLQAESQHIAALPGTDEDHRKQLEALHDKYAVLQTEITTDVRQAANKVAQAQGLHLIVTREFVGYAGRDVTPEVEHELGVVETPSPAPTAAAVASATPMPNATRMPTPAPSPSVMTTATPTATPK